MTKWFQWIVLTAVTGSPLLSIVILLVIWTTIDRFTFRVLPDPLQGFFRWRRVERLRRTLSDNPADRRTRAELADLYLQQRRAGLAYETLAPNLKAGDRDPDTLFLLGVAAKGAGRLDEALALLEEAHAEQPDFKLSLIKLELGQVKLSKGDAKGAAELLAKYLEKRRSSVKGRVLLAQAKEKLGEVDAAKKLKEQAWDEYRGLPRYLRRDERLWAWRAQPQRPITYALIAVAAAVMFSTFIAPGLGDALSDPNLEP